jgi:hypothetical protein
MRPVGAGLLRAGGRTNMTEVIVAPRCFADALETLKRYKNWCVDCYVKLNLVSLSKLCSWGFYVLGDEVAQFWCGLCRSLGFRVTRCFCVFL